MGLLNPGGPIAQSQRNACSISPVEVIFTGSVRSQQDAVNLQLGIDLPTHLANRLQELFQPLGRQILRLNEYSGDFEPAVRLLRAAVPAVGS